MKNATFLKGILIVLFSQVIVLNCNVISKLDHCVMFGGNAFIKRLRVAVCPMCVL